MKCPKCNYLGFETGDRCKNCGYDFSLIPETATEPFEIDVDIRNVDTDIATAPEWLDQIDGALAPLDPVAAPVELEPSPMQLKAAPVVRDPIPVEFAVSARPPAAQPQAEPTLPFVAAFDTGSDEPLIKLPATPRPPLAVRRTPVPPRFRVMPKPMPKEAGPPLAFEEESGNSRERELEATPIVSPRPVSRIWKEPDPPRRAIERPVEIGDPRARVAAAAVDHLLLLGIDAGVIYFTLRIAGLPMDQWGVLPAIPLVCFLVLLKLSYFWAFTAVGGQTIGKMALRIRVVTADNEPIDAALAVRRTLAGAVSTIILGLGYAPAFFDADHRALHDRFARTRVIALPSA